MWLPLALNDTLWSLGRWMILIALSRSARKVVLTREIAVRDQPAVRWLRSDVRTFMQQVATLSDALRPIANLDALQNIGNRLTVELSILTSAAYRVLRSPFSAPGAPGYAVQLRIEDGNILTHFTHGSPQNFVHTLIATRSDRGDLEAFQQSWGQYDFPGADLIAADGKCGHHAHRKTLSQGDSVYDRCWAARGQAGAA